MEMYTSWIEWLLDILGKFQFVATDFDALFDICVI